MDPLSAAAAVAGLVKAAQEVVKLLGPYASASKRTPPIASHVRDEVDSTRTVLIGLQTLVQELSGRVSHGGALISVEQIVVILTSGVLLFAELEGAVRGLISVPTPLPSGYLGGRLFPLIQDNLPLRARMHWARREAILEPLLARLRGFKMSVAVVLSLLQCDSDRRAEQLQADLAENVGALLDSNCELSRRMRHLEDALDTSTVRPRTIKSNFTLVTTRSPNPIARLDDALVPPPTETTALAPCSHVPPALEFERDLESSFVYRRAQRDSMDFSFRSSTARTHAWSILSGDSLANISVLSVIALPLNLEQVTNNQHYIRNTQKKQLTSMRKEYSSPPGKMLWLNENRSIFHDCIRIHFQLCQIPGFPELFDAELRVQQIDNGMDLSFLYQHGKARDWIWQFDLFRALKNIFRKDVAYELLADKLGWSLGKDTHPDLSRRRDEVTGIPIAAFCTLSISNLCRGSKNIFSVKDAVQGNNVRFLKFILHDLVTHEPSLSRVQVLACISRVVDRLADDGIINFFSENDLDAILRPSETSSPSRVSTYQSALAKLLIALRVSVRDLLCLIGTVDKSMCLPQISPSLEKDLPAISTTCLESYARCQIDLLLFAEKMLLAPPCRHLWLEAVHQWCTTTERHGGLVGMEGLKTWKNLPKGIILDPRMTALRFCIFQFMEQQGYIPASGLCYNYPIREDKNGAAYVELVSRLPQIYPQTAELLQEVIAMALDELNGVGATSWIQRSEFLQCQLLVKDTLDVLNVKMRQNELNELHQALVNLGVHLDGWEDTRAEEFGRLMQADKLQCTVSSSTDITEKTCHVYLFEKMLLCLPESRFVTSKWKGSDGLNDMWQRNDRAQPLRLYLNRIRDISYLEEKERGTFPLRFRWDALSDSADCTINFISKRQMIQWYKCLRKPTQSARESAYVASSTSL